MHLSLILFALSVVWYVRRCGANRADSWTNRWQRTLGSFLFAPLLLLTTAIAVLSMGTQGQMLGLPVGWIGYAIAIGFLTAAAGIGIWLLWQGWRSLRQVQTYPTISVANTTGRLVEVSAPIAAQVGFWQSELVVSQGLLTLLSAEQLDAVLTHEQAHHYYRDTFWFFWLGWFRQITTWLPQTASLWEELLLLRELRADRWAAQRVDPLLLAESLLLVIKAPLMEGENYSVAFSAATAISRLEERIEALMTPESQRSHHTFQWTLLLWTFLPLLTVLFHR